MNAFTLSTFFTSVFSIGLGLFVLSKGVRKFVNVLWCLTCLSIGAWSLGLGFMMSASSEPSAVRWLLFQYVGAIMIPMFFLHFVIRVLDLRKPAALAIGYGLAGYLQWMNFFGRMEAVRPMPPYNFFTKPGHHYWIFVVYFFALVLYAHALLLWEMRSAKGRLRNQIKFIFLGTFIGFIGGSTSFFLVFDIPIRPYGVYAVPIYILSVSYAIFKHQLMDINVVIRRTLVYSGVSAVLASAYAVVVLLIVRAFQGGLQSSTLVSLAGVAFVIGILFHPVSRWAQNFVDNKFFRKRVDHESKLMAFSSEVVSADSLENMTRSLFEIVHDTLHPVSMAFYLQADGDSDFIQTSPDAQIALPKRLPAVNAWSDYFSQELNPLIGGAPPQNGGDPAVRATALREMSQAKLNAAFPLLHRKSLLGFLLLGEKRSGEPYSDEDIMLIQIVMNQASLAYERPKLLQEITAALVHEIKMPLANISLPAELTFMELADIENHRKSVFDALPRLKSRMKYIMDQALLAGGRVEAMQELSGSQTIAQTSVNLATTIQSSLQALDALIRKNAVVVELRFSPQPCDAVGNVKQLEIVFVNLIKNAVEAMTGPQFDGERVVRVAVWPDDRDVVIEIADSGPGIPANHTGALFRSHFTTKGANGTGMGLYVARQIIRGHRGVMDVKSENGKGTMFTIRLRRFTLEAQEQRG